MTYHLMIEEDQPLCGGSLEDGYLTYREDAADCVPCWRAYAVRLKEQAEALRETNARLTLERDDALTGRLPPLDRPPQGAWTATQTANYWSHRAQELGERLKQADDALRAAYATGREQENKRSDAERKRDEMEAAYKTLFQHVRADHSGTECTICHPALVARDEAVAAMAALKGNMRALLGDPDGQ